MAKGGLPGNMQALMKQAQQMQQKLLDAQERADEYEEEGTSGGGMVKVVANGKNQVVSLAIEKDVVDPEDVDMLQDLIIAATNEALRKVGEKVKTELGKITGGMNLPGM